MTIDETQPISAHEQGEHGSTDLRTRSHAMWSSVAPSWDEHADFVDVRSPEIADQMLALAALRPGNRVLELACGPGGVGLAAAPLVTPGEVVCSDIAAPMTAIAARRAKARG
jgi:ubiquinone/menaquinone biosynthesis C-methylase UbiE